MVSLDDAVIARLDRKGERFEILVEPELAYKFREGEGGVELADILAVEEVFKDAHRGDRATDEILNETFSTTEVMKIAAYIIEKGEIQLTTEQRKKMQTEKKKQVINLLARNCINPVTKTPHPPQRLEMALDEIKFNIDPFKSAESQVNEALKALRPVIPIRMEMTTIAVKVHGSHYGKLIGDVRGYGKILKEEWTKDGDWVFVIEIPAGLQVDFFDEINGKTHGEAQSKILNQ
ncbi:MAG: ribosome assembly factor SBDS [Thermoplasmatota archaeon]